MKKHAFTEKEAEAVLQGLSVGLGLALCEEDTTRLKMGIELCHRTLHMLEETLGAEWVQSRIDNAEEIIRGKLLAMIASGDFAEDDEFGLPKREGDEREEWN